ncbi:hypothetical protein SteCoe_7603 [Stentor coeruleus]|uniref:Uncharacterized protein n=1 Tax=Stentor coeruleus TaxID=5963 RepID=A0A1R2CMB5_9CILI|nr:hypothetical protein SteCoe_7603 [Stentor coeruleus]
MEYKCSYPDCQEDAFWECSCSGNLKNCDTHSRTHSKEKQCLTKYVKNYYMELLTKKYQNALNRLESDSIKLAQEMINEVNICLRNNFDTIKSVKQKIKELVFNDSKDQAEILTDFANSLFIMRRYKKDFVLSVEKLLGFKKYFDKDDLVSEYHEDEFEFENVTTFEEAFSKIIEIKKDLKESYEKNKILVEEFDVVRHNLVLENEEFKLENFELKNELYKLKVTLSNYDKVSEEFNSNTTENLIGEINIDNFSTLLLEKKKELIARMDFKDFSRDFIYKKWFIYQINLTTIKDHIFICDKLSRLYVLCR